MKKAFLFFTMRIQILIFVLFDTFRNVDVFLFLNFLSSDFFFELFFFLLRSEKERNQSLKLISNFEFSPNMFLLLLFFSSCKTKICICADDCSSYCPDNIPTFYYPLSNNNNIIQSLSQNGTEIHVFLSSAINEFVFDLDLSK